MEKKTMIYDLPTRLFHWTFVGLILVAGIISQTVDDDSGVFGYHMICGMVLTLAIFLRILWGFWGTHYARFSSFALHPRDLIHYFRNVFNSQAPTWPGHNPASSWSALGMMVLVLGLGVSGYAMVTGGDKFSIKEVHEILAYSLFAVIMMHVGGLLLHTFVHRDRLIISMFTGSKLTRDGDKRPVKLHGTLGVLALALVAGFLVHLFSQYQVASGILNLWGDKLYLVEDAESSEDGESSGEGESPENDD